MQDIGIVWLPFLVLIVYFYSEGMIIWAMMMRPGFIRWEITHGQKLHLLKNQMEEMHMQFLHFLRCLKFYCLVVMVNPDITTIPGFIIQDHILGMVIIYHHQRICWLTQHLKILYGKESQTLIL